MRYFKLKQGQEIKFWPEMVAGMFIGLHYYWFTMRDNSLYGKQDQAMQCLTYFLKTGEELPDQGPDMDYVIAKVDDFLSSTFEKADSQN